MKYISKPFYRSRPGLRLRFEVLREQRFECQYCKVNDFYTKADTVHHVYHFSKHLELSLMNYYIDRDGSPKQNSVVLCHLCHEVEHGFRQPPKLYLTEEKWCPPGLNKPYFNLTGKNRTKA